MAKKIIIYNFEEYFGGTLVLSVLCKTLRDLGYDARTIFVPSSCFSNANNSLCFFLRFWFVLIKRYVFHSLCFFLKIEDKVIRQTPVTTIDGLEIQYNPFFDKKESIVIYPEIVYGNPMLSKNVVRWLLFHYKYPLESRAYKDTDFFVAYRKIFNNIKLNPQEILLTINHFDRKLYRQYNFSERKGKCYIIRKGKYRDDLPQKFDGPCFDDNMSEEEVVKMFNEHKFCYCYDTQTFYSSIAAVCGCIPIVVLEAGKTELDYLSSEKEIRHYGVAYGDSLEQINYAIETRDKLLNALDFDEKNKDNVSAFIELLEQKFGGVARL